MTLLAAAILCMLMRHKLLAALLATLMTSAVTAQVPPQPEETRPPRMDEPDHWEIHGPNGATGFEFTADFWFNDGWCDAYILEVTGEVNGQPYTSVSLVLDCGNGSTLDVWSGDSGNWVTWEWHEDHYKKVGGTSNTRTFHPVD